MLSYLYFSISQIISNREGILNVSNGYFCVFSLLYKQFNKQFMSYFLAWLSLRMGLTLMRFMVDWTEIDPFLSEFRPFQQLLRYIKETG